MDVNSVLFYIFMRVKSILSAFALMVSVCMATILTSCEKKDVSVTVTGIEVTPSSVELRPGDTQVLEVSVLPENATDKTYTWSSSDESVATVADDIVTAVADGSAVITAVTADGSHKASVIVKVATPYDGIVASSAGAVFMGDQWGIGYDEVFLYLLSGDVKYSDLSLSGKGSALWLDLNLPGTGKAVLPAHHYTALLEDEQDMEYTIQTGVDMGDYGIIGSFVYENNGKAEYVMLEDGTVDITLDGSTYTVDAVVKSEGKEYKFRYTGAIEVETYTGGGDGGDGGDGEWQTVNVGKLTQARFEYCGDEYGTNGVSDNWVLYLYDDGVSVGSDGFTGVGDIMMIELDCTVGVKDHIAPGTYPVVSPTEILDAGVLKPFTTVPGLQNSAGYIYGTWYLSSKYSEDAKFSGYYGATEGSVTVDKTDDNVYSISFEIKDTDYNGIVSGSFEGKASIFDSSSPASINMRSVSMSQKSSLKSARRIAFRK